MPAARPYLFPLVLLTVLAVVAGCELFRDAAESRARFFLETLVQQPDNRERLSELSKPADGQGFEAVLDGLGTRLAIDYLRARHRQGMTLELAVTAAQRLDAGRRLVLIAASADPTGLRQESDGRVRFQVALELSEQRQWLVTRVTAE
ncbi:MAG: hypothetical protein HY942_04270 [Gammaproteobacteria bacterium]|nr:hypothetical protein [Gammaproteobacteria bacterium]